jgi:AcrR family transcriptional regulator
LARDGYSASSIARIADEAGVQKRMVLYYFKSREQLFDVVIRRIGDRLIGQVEARLDDLEASADVAVTGLDQLWEAVTHDRALLTAYFGLVAESVTDPQLQRSMDDAGEGFRRLIRRLVGALQGGGSRVAIDEQVLTVAMVAAMQGFTLEYLQHGDTPALRSAIALFQGWLTQD